MKKVNFDLDVKDKAIIPIYSNPNGQWYFDPILDMLYENTKNQNPGLHLIKEDTFTEFVSSRQKMLSTPMYRIRNELKEFSGLEKEDSSKWESVTYSLTRSNRVQSNFLLNSRN